MSNNACSASAATRDENIVVSYSNKLARVTISGWDILLPVGEYTLDDLRQITDVVDRARDRLMYRRGDLKWYPGHE